MTEWSPNYEGEPQVRADIGGGIVRLSAGANNDGRRPSKDGRDATGLFPWAAWSGVSSYVGGHADTLDAAKAAAVAAAIQILTDALAEATAAASDTNPITTGAP